MLGKNNCVAALLRRDIPHLVEQHCVAHREDLGIDDACKHFSLKVFFEGCVYTLNLGKSCFRDLLCTRLSVTELDLIDIKPIFDI